MKLRALGVLLTATACDSWSSVQASYCTHHAGVGDCAVAGGQGGGSGGNGGGTGGGSTGGAGMTSIDDGGPPVDWVRVLGGVHDDDAVSLVIDPDETQVAVGGRFVGAIDLGGTSFVSTSSNTEQGMFVALLDPGDGGTTDGIGIDCSRAPDQPAEMPLVFTDAGLVLASTCYSTPGTFISRDGVVLALDGGLASNQGSDEFLLRLGTLPALEFFNTPQTYEPDKRVVASAVAGQPYFMVAVDAPGGALLFGDAGITDGGSWPMLARIGATDLQPQIVDTIDCSEAQTVEWESLAADPSGQHVFGMIHSSTNPTAHYCQGLVPNTSPTSGAGNSSPGLHRVFFIFDSAGDSVFGEFNFGATLPDAGPMLLASDQARSVYFAGYVDSSPQNFALDAGSLVVGNVDPHGANVSTGATFVPTLGSTAQFVGLAVLPGVSPDIWLLGTVTGTLLDGSGAVVVSSHDSHSDAFLLKLSPTNLLPTQTYVLGRPNVDETAAALAVHGHHVYVALTAAPGSGVTAASFVFGGVSAPLLGGRDVLVFRLTVP